LSELGSETDGVQGGAREALQQSAARAPDGDLWLTFDAPRVRVEALWAHPRAKALWLGPNTEGASEDACIGFGVARQFVADGPERWGLIKAAAHEALMGFRPLAVLGAAPSLPRVFGGFAFQAGRAQRAPWQAFGDARFVLPRIVYQVTRSSATLSVAVSRAERSDPSQALSEALSLRSELAAFALELGEPAQPSVSLAPSQEDWRALVEGALGAIALGDYEKLVVSQHRQLDFEQPLCSAATLATLSSRQSATTRFAFRTTLGSFVGATPERLLRKRGLQFATEALAGTFRLEDAADPQRPVQSPKELAEHRPVLEALARRLEPFAQHVHFAPEPTLRHLHDLIHLCTPVSGTLKRQEHIVDLVAALHPTPAVCGVPTQAALAWLAQHEPHERGWYAGPVGWFDAEGDGDFVVALRCGVLHDHSAHLYAGAGIVPGSQASAEYEETQLKLTALGSALRVRCSARH
jgi:isochorismate synthase